ncbi:uncharacterized protein DNG_05939 [Cephalotrichum gorgonifer]|uniref:Uncharacterized protein n=1 Tax=Cephalotrichum gorgonifer TaxID=2041049 RepID=A0AAE8SWR1_9PEZI|nr:uncharacterized protein DNG_05939 [Cephalotrichum gorgonifer]
MRPLSPFPLAALAAAASISPRQSQPPSVRINSAKASGPLCGPNTWTALIDTKFASMVIGFDKNAVDTDDTQTGNCIVEVSLTYPPGCTSVTINPTVGTWTYGNETVTGSFDIEMKAPPGHTLTASRTFVNDAWRPDNPALVSADAYPMDGSAVYRQDTETEVLVTIETTLGISQTEDSGGLFKIEQLALNFTNQVVDTDWENCVLI